MTRSEIYKIRTHRTPLVCAAALLIGVLAPSIVLMWYTPKDPSAYNAFSDVYELSGLLLGIVFGGWLLGAEYRQGTVKRLLASEPRRIRALTTKGLVGAASMSTVLAVVGTIGWLAARFVGSMNDVTVPWQGRSLLAAGLAALVAAAVAYSLSVITRSDSFAMVGTASLLLVLHPLLASIPWVGKFTLGSVLYHVLQAVSGDPFVDPTELSTGAATFLLLCWLATFAHFGATLFTRRDV